MILAQIITRVIVVPNAVIVAVALALCIAIIVGVVALICFTKGKK